MTFCDRLKKYRADKGFTQPELSKASGISVRMIQKYEAGIARPRWEASEKLATALGIPVVDLLGQSGVLVAEAHEKGGSKASRDVSDLVNELVGVFAGGELPQAEREAYMAALTEAYFKSSAENKKYTPKKYKK